MNIWGRVERLSSRWREIEGDGLLGCRELYDAHGFDIDRRHTSTVPEQR
jgi:hypothetical protein